MTILRDIENTGIEQIIQAYSWMFRNVQPCSDILRNIKAYPGILSRSSLSI